MGYNFFEGCQGISEPCHKQAPTAVAVEDGIIPSQAERRPIDKKTDHIEAHAFSLPPEGSLLSSYEEYLCKSRPVDVAILDVADSVFPSVITIDMLVQALPYTPGYIAQRVYLLVRQGKLCKCDRYSYKGSYETQEKDIDVRDEDALYRIGCDIYSLLSWHHPLKLEALGELVKRDVALGAIRVFKHRAHMRRGHPRPLIGDAFGGYLLGPHVKNTVPDCHEIFNVLKNSPPMTANEIAVLIMYRSGSVLRVLNRYKNRSRGLSFTCFEDDTQHILWSVSNGSNECHR